MSFNFRSTINELTESRSDIFSNQFTNTLSSKMNIGSSKVIESQNLFSQNSGICPNFLNSQLNNKQNVKMTVCEIPNPLAKKKIPGPAGTLPKLKEGQGINESLIPQMNNQLVSQRSQRTSSNSIQSNTSWNSAMSDLGAFCPKIFEILDRFPLGSVSKRAKMKTLPSCKVPVICASIESISLHSIDASLVLKDASGSMPGALHREIVKEFGDKIYVGTVIVLKQVGVFSPATGRNCYLNITPNNVVRIYTKRMNQVASQEESPSVIKIQDPDFCDLTSFCDSIMKMTDSSAYNSTNPSKVNSKSTIKSNIPKSFGMTKENLPNIALSGNKNKKESKRSELSWEATDISAELLDDWIDDEEIKNVVNQQESELQKSIATEPTLTQSNISFQPDETNTIHSNKSFKSKSTNIFNIDTNDDFMLSFGSSTKIFPSTDAGKQIPLVVGFKRNQIGDNSTEISKKSKYSPPEEHLTDSKIVSQHVLCTAKSATLPSLPSNFKFKSITQSTPNLSSQNNSFQVAHSDHQNVIKNYALKKDSKPTDGQVISLKTVDNTDKDFFEKLLEGLDDEMLDDF